MRRAEKEITDQSTIDDIITSCFVCHVGMYDGAEPYVVAMNFGYRDGVFYVHSATEGRKVDILERNPRVCLQLHTDDGLVEAEQACGYGARFRSVVATGEAVVVSDSEEKRRALNAIMHHYAGREFEFTDAQLGSVTVFAVRAESVSAKVSGV